MRKGPVNNMKKYNVFKYASGFIIFFALVALDQLTKNLAVIHLKNKAPFVIVKEVFEFHYLDGGNTGAAWGILSGQISFFVIMTIIVCLLLFALLIKIEFEIPMNRDIAKKFTLLQAVILLLISGAVGNLIDRICNGYVIDFIYFKFINFPIFNVADCYVTVSAFLLVIMCVFFMSDEEFAKIFSFRGRKKIEE